MLIINMLIITIMPAMNYTAHPLKMDTENDFKVTI